LSRHDKADKSGKSGVTDDTNQEASKISVTDLETGFNSEVLSSLQERVSKARKPQAPESETKGRGYAIGMAYRLSMELVVGIVVGGFIGWWLDKWLSTKPIFLLVMLLLV
jgi:F0F1-type ATP synthase assembly protein I